MSLVVLLVPAIAGVLLLRTPARVAGWFATAAALVTAGASMVLHGAVPIDVTWFAALGIGFRLDPSGASSVLVAAAAVTMVPTVWIAGRRLGDDAPGFLALLTFLQASLNGLFMSSDLVLTYVFWETTLIPSLWLLGAYGGEKRRDAWQTYLVYAVTGSFLMLVSIVALRPLSGAESYAFADLLPATTSLAAPIQIALFAGFAAAFAVKLPLVPVHGWLIDFHRENHPSGAADVAGTMYKVGGFGFFAWAIPLLPEGAAAFQPWMLALAVVTALWGAIAATQQTDLKSLLAYASLSHMGVIGVGLFSLRPEGASGAMLLLAAQMVSTGALFLIAGMLHERRGGFELERFGGLAKSAPALAAVTVFTLFASIGVPGLSNFPGEFLALLGAFHAQPFWGVLAASSVVVAGIYGVNAYQRLFLGRMTDPTPCPDLTRSEAWVLAPLIAAILLFGMAPHAASVRIQGDATRIADAPAAVTAEVPR